MINLNEYDDLTPNTKTWYNPTYGKIYSNEIRYRRYFTIVQKYIPNTKETNYYLVMSDDIIPNKKCYDVYPYKSNGVKFKISAFLFNLPLINIGKQINIVIDLKEEDEHTSIYYLDI